MKPGSVVLTILKDVGVELVLEQKLIKQMVREYVYAYGAFSPKDGVADF